MWTPTSVCSPAQCSSSRRPCATTTDEVPPEQQLAPGPYRKVGNIFVVNVHDHPYKYGWEINRCLRDLKLEHRGEVRVHPDTPEVRERLFRVRHLVNIDMMTTDEAKDMIGVPRAVGFAQLKTTLPRNYGAGLTQDRDVEQSWVDFMETRRNRLRDIMQRDALELRLLKRRKELAAAGGGDDSTAAASDKA